MYVGLAPIQPRGHATMAPAQPPTTAIPTQRDVPTHYQPPSGPNIYPQQPPDIPPPNIYPSQPPTHADIVDAGHPYPPATIQVDAITVAGGPTPIQDIGPSTLPTPVVDQNTGQVVGSVILDQTTGAPVVTPITSDVLYTPEKNNWTPIIYAGAAVLALSFLFGGKTRRKK